MLREGFITFQQEQEAAQMSAPETRVISFTAITERDLTVSMSSTPTTSHVFTV
jgi:hypothetical protein